MHLLARLRLQLARHPSVWWSVVALVAIVVALVVAGALRGVEQQRRAWGSRRTVWVATSAAVPGEPLLAEARDYPLAVVPAGALDRAPVDAVARQHVAAGEVLVAADIDLLGTAGLIPTGWVAVPVPQRASAVVVGDAVATFANGQRLGDGVVVGRDDEQVLVAVPADIAAAVTQATPGGTVVIGLLGPDP